MFFQKMNTFQGFQGAGRPQFFMRCPRLCNYHILLLALKGCYRCRRWCQVTTGTSCGTKKLNSGSNINKEMKNSNTHPPEMDITNSTRTCARGKLPAIPRSYREKNEAATEHELHSVAGHRCACLRDTPSTLCGLGCPKLGQLCAHDRSHQRSFRQSGYKGSSANAPKRAFENAC